MVKVEGVSSNLNQNQNYKDVLQSKLGKMKSTCMEIETGGAYPSLMPVYRISLKKVPLLEEEIKSLLREGIIQPSNSQCTFLLF